MIGGNIEDWRQDDEGRWYRPDHPEDGIVTLSDGVSFADYFAKRAAEEEPKRQVLKSVIISRLIEAGKIEAARAALDQDAAAYARWWAPDRPAVNFDDPDALALLKAIGADPDVILA